MEIILLFFLPLLIYYLCITGKIYTMLFHLFFQYNIEKINETYFFWDTIRCCINIMPRYKKLKVWISSRLELNEYSAWYSNSNILKNLYTQTNDTPIALLYPSEIHSLYTQIHVPSLENFDAKLQKVLKRKLKVHTILWFKESLSGLNILWSYKLYFVLWNWWKIPYSEAYIEIYETIEQERGLKNTSPNVTLTRYIGLVLIALTILIFSMYFWFLYFNEF